ncbi:MAG: anaerobic ribonucleoside-triphosphate reductase activating protein [Candidatus Magasanikbacteria bacterium RIFCSPHIGHO2_02_FULL_47_14]|uniref:Anaerobic ribonucleoside-triphosphate reductase activating protein n=1 Tax=Candidatus Magasanikbacteria bacterium RIFCSPHIGHO2_02_FULL_47_14 TaxID=1798680 RepID=A0A1F6LZH9_9BACT|nr:MAG: anaerobic ribonucleoside-triphosphate reductase activating protein [Candidatus Magasanikbacteria bacterium RIFCSPHIGHO2_02_FULL_47_14]
MLISGVQKFTMLDFPEKTACIVFTPGCNFRCGYCHNPEFVLPEEIQKLKKNFISEATFFRFLEGRQGLLDGVVITGGEPTMMGDLGEFIGKVKERDFLVKLDTNGSNPERVKPLLEKHLIDYVAMDVKTSLASYRSLVGAGGRAEKIAQSMRLFMESACQYEFRITLVKEFHTYEMLEDLAKEIQGAKKLYLQSFRPGNTLDPLFKNYHAFSSSEMEEIRGIFSRTVAEVTIR